MAERRKNRKRKDVRNVTKIKNSTHDESPRSARETSYSSSRHRFFFSPENDRLNGLFATNDRNGKLVWHVWAVRNFHRTSDVWRRSFGLSTTSVHCFSTDLRKSFYANRSQPLNDRSRMIGVELSCFATDYAFFSPDYRDNKFRHMFRRFLFISLLTVLIRFLWKGTHFFDTNNRSWKNDNLHDNNNHNNLFSIHCTLCIVLLSVMYLFIGLMEKNCLEKGWYSLWDQCSIYCESNYVVSIALRMVHYINYDRMLNRISGIVR